MMEVLWNEYLNLPELSKVEKRLIALRTIVFSIYRLKGGSTGCTGDAVNLMHDISEIALILPRGTINSIFVLLKYQSLMLSFIWILKILIWPQ